MKTIAKTAIKKSFDLMGLELRRKRQQKELGEMEDGRLIVPKIWKQPVFRALIPVRLRPPDVPFLLCSPAHIKVASSGFVASGREVRGIDWDWVTQTDLSSIAKQALIIICKLPKNERHWRVVKQT